MSVKSIIEDGSGKGSTVRVTTRGELVVGKVEFSQAYTIEATATATAYNFVGPISGSQFIITDVLLYADKNIGVNDASVQLYEATSSSETTVSKTVLDLEMVKQTSRDVTGLNLAVSEGKWLNLKTDDATIFATVMGYYINV